jgi:hypothetical protein
LYETKSESEPKLEQKFMTAAVSVFFVVHILMDLSNLKDKIKKEQI